MPDKTTARLSAQSRAVPAWSTRAVLRGYPTPLGGWGVLPAQWVLRAGFSGRVVKSRALKKIGDTSVARTRSSAKSAGARFERSIADYLAGALEDDRIDRRVKRGINDRGDISGLRVHGQRLVVECKDSCRVSLPEWTGEAHVEAGNDDALVGVVVHKRKGVADGGRQWVSLTVDDLLALITGERHGHRIGLADEAP
jgi:hypothetical protein